MILRTEIFVEKFPLEISYNTKIMWLGSCFANNMGKRMQELHFPTIVNPFGAIFNPASLANNIDILLDNKQFTEADIFQQNDIWNAFPFHSQYSNQDKNIFLQDINNQVKTSAEFLKQTNLLFITLGTAFVYQYIESGKVVNNCHKLPAKQFNKKMLSVSNIVEILSELTDKLYTLNKDIEIIFSVSPIRHLSDGAHNNQISKSSLLLAINEVCNKKGCFYFPAYEILLDDLRDYRFYDDDMCHPNKLAQDYIWEKFINAFATNETKSIISEVENINKAVNHRPVNPNTEAHKKFIENTKSKIKKLENKYPFLNLKY